MKESEGETFPADSGLKGSDNRSAPPQKPRTEFIDHLRVLLTILVVFHHAAITYGAPGGWYYREVPVNGAGTVSSILLTMFVSTNQAFFMGFFFLLAGYFTPGSLAKKGSRSFMLDRIVRLGIPLAVYGFVISPMTVALSATAKGKPFLDTWLHLAGSFSVGPLWFAEALLIFTAGFLLWHNVRKKVDITPEQAPLPGHTALLISALFVGALALLLRQWIPVGQTVLGLQLGYFSSYTFLFYLGCLAWRHRWLERVDSRLAVPWLIISLFAIVGFCLTAVQSGAFQGVGVDFSGGLSGPAIIYAIQEPFVAWGIILALLWLFRLKFNSPSSIGHALAKGAYTIYIIHPPILVGISLLLRTWDAPSLIKFPLAASAAFAVCAVLAGLILRIPAAKRIVG